MNAPFPPIPTVNATSGGKVPRICVATWEIEGLSRNAGIGTAYTSLADAFKRAGFEVTILFLLGCHPTDGNISDWVEHYRKQKGIELIPLPMAHHPRIHAAWASSVAYHTYSWLKDHQHDFDIIHFPECQGLGFYCLMAKRQGLAFRNTTFIVGTHGPTFWVKEGSQDNLRNLGELEIDYMERYSVAAADIVVSPTQYLLGWMQHNGWKLPEETYVAPYIRPHGALFESPASPEKRAIREFVFFGRLEIRKGLKLFCDALDQLCAEPGVPPFKVAFLGKETQMFGRSSIGYICDRSKKWPVPWQIISNKFQAGAIEYLRGEGRLAVISSLSDNFPNTGLECVGAGIPFLATKVGGIPEIIAPEDHERVCFEPRPDILAERLRTALENGAAPARPRVDFTDNERRWTAWHSALVNQPKTTPAAASADAQDPDSLYPLVSICLAYNIREKGVASTLASISEQDYPNIEVVLVDCGSDGAAASGSPVGGEKLNGAIQRLHQRSAQIGMGRNAAARQAKGEFLLFLDDHSLLLPSDAISTFVRVAQRVKADLVTSALTFYIGSSNGSAERMEHSRRPFLGGDVATGAYVNCFGSPNALVRRSAFDAIGGFSDDAMTTLDDWEFMAKAGLLGLRIETIPDVLLWHREDQDQESLVHSLMNGIRSVRPYTEPARTTAPGIQQALANVMRFGQGVKFERDARLGSPLSRGEQGPAVTG